MPPIPASIEAAAASLTWSSDGVAMRAQQLGQRQARALRLEVVERDVDRCQCLRRDPGAAHGRAGPQEPRVELLDVVGVLADRRAGDLLRVRVLRGSAGPLRVAEAHAFVALLGADLCEQEHDLGHGTLPAREDLRVGDGGGEGEGDGR
jgi:hypothetical protein